MSNRTRLDLLQMQGIQQTGAAGSEALLSQMLCIGMSFMCAVQGGGPRHAAHA